MKQKIVLLFAILIMVNIHAQDRFTTFNSGTDFTAITVDGENERVWAGTTQNGVFKINIDEGSTVTSFSTFNPGGTPDLSNIKITSMVSDKLGNVWIGHQGINAVGSQGAMERISSSLSVKHYWPETNFLGFFYYDRGDGLGTLKVNAITVDKNNKVWATHLYRDLLSTPNYYLAPGVIATKRSNQTKFTTKGGWKNTSGDNAIQPAELPYPAYTWNPEPDQTAQNRSMFAISSDDNEVWVFMLGYIPRENESAYIPKRILRYDLQGNYIASGTAAYGGFTFSDMGFPSAGGIINGICANNEKGTWVTTNFSGRGFSVYKNGTWQYISRNTTGFNKIIPIDAKFNTNAIWKDSSGRVFMGTDKGLIVYNGEGNVNVANSYKIYTNYDFGATTGNALNVYDITMLSNNIKGGCANPNNINESWVATDTGIMKGFFPPEGMILYNIKDHKAFDTTTVLDTEKTIFLADLRNEVTITDTILDHEIPSIGSDGTSSTVFRYYTNDPEGFYTTFDYKFYVDDSNDSYSIEDVGNSEYIKEFGKFTLKDINSYEGNPPVSELKYVEFIYQHPEWIHAAKYITNENYAKFDFKVFKISSSEEVFTHPIKISVPPVLLAHGVWTNTHSFDSMETYLKAHGYKTFMINKAWRADAGAAEHPYEEDSNIIPRYIRNMKSNAAGHMFSAGKVNVVAHSRGGLYTRAYIEDIDTSHPYKYDVNSLITLNTPHYGAQGGNLSMDKRVIPSNSPIAIADHYLPIADWLNLDYNENGDLTVGSFGSLPTPERDRAERWGAKNLLVEIDNLSGITEAEDPDFIKTLNNSVNHSKMSRVPIHTISSTWNPCVDINDDLFCNDLDLYSNIYFSFFSKWIKAMVVLYKVFAFTTNAPSSLNELTSSIYNGESNDFVVALSSQKAGLSDSQTTNFTGVAHSDIVIAGGITDYYAAHSFVSFLLRANVHDDTTAGNFSQTGIVPQELTYSFLSDFTGGDAGRNTNILTSKVFINKDPMVFDNTVAGGTISYSIYSENVDQIMVVYENDNFRTDSSFENRIDAVQDNSFSFTIPEGYSGGNTTITAYGFKDDEFGVSIDTIEFNVGLPANLTLQSIHFEYENPIILNQDDYTYRVIGTYSDGVDRELNNTDIVFTIEDTAITSQVDDSTIKGEAVGSTLLTAVINGFEDTILVKVEENPSLQQTILTGFYGIPNTDNTTIDVNWKTLREYENATFVLETSRGTPDNFTEINQQAGNGTTNTPAQFNYEDTTFGANTLIYYRIKMIDTQGNITYSSIIEINLSTAGVGGEDLSNLNIELYPNPAKTNEVTLKLNTRFTDKNAKLELYSIQGKRLAVQTLNVIEGANSFKLKIGEGLTNGIYLVRVTTTNYIKTVKLIVE